MSEADDITQRPAIYIPMPSLPNAPRQTHVTFNGFAKSSKALVVGQVADRALFSQSLGWADNEDTHNHYIKAPGTGFYVPPELAQFEPTIRQMIGLNYVNHGTDGFCYLGVLQAVILPKEGDARTFIKGHRDIPLNELLAKGQTANWQSYVVSDSLMTGFAERDFSDEELDRIAHATDPNSEQRVILDQGIIPYASKDPYDIVKFDSYTPHAHANPTEPTRRTFMIMSFVAADATIDYGFNNPWLDRAVEQLKSRDHNGGEHPPP